MCGLWQDAKTSILFWFYVAHMVLTIKQYNATFLCLDIYLSCLSLHCEVGKFFKAFYSFYSTVHVVSV